MNAAQMKCYQYFVANLKELYNKYPDMFVVIHESAVQDAYSTLGEAVKSGILKYGQGNFIVQQCVGRLFSSEWAQDTYGTGCRS